MKKSYFGQNNEEYIEVAYAPTGRAKCKSCNKLIENKNLRISNSTDNDHFIGKQWYHVNCFTLRNIFKELQPENDIFNLQNLIKEDRDLIIDHMNVLLQALKDTNDMKTKRSKSTKSAKNSKIKVKSKLSKITLMETKSQHSVKKKSKKYQQQQESQQKTFPSKKPSAKNKREVSPQKHQDFKGIQAKGKRLTRSKSKKQINSAQKIQKKYTKSAPKKQVKSKQKLVPKEKKKAEKKKVVKKQKPQGYTKQQSQKFKELLQKYYQMTIDNLKAILSKNGQPKTGIKGDLAQKCADGELLGRIPMCSSCGGGKLRFDRKTGIYKCPGYMDDQDFIRCSQFYTFSEIIRQPWI